MTDITPNHPAVDAADRAATRWMEDRELETDLDGTAYMLTAAIPHLDADDLRNTDAAEEIRTEGWLQGWAAGRDLDGDEDATPYLRNTPAGRALKAEAWEEAVLRYARGSAETRRVLASVLPNPYRDGEA